MKKAILAASQISSKCKKPQAGRDYVKCQEIAHSHVGFNPYTCSSLKTDIWPTGMHCSRAERWHCCNRHKDPKVYCLSLLGSYSYNPHLAIHRCSIKKKIKEKQRYNIPHKPSEFNAVSTVLHKLFIRHRDAVSVGITILLPFKSEIVFLSETKHVPLVFMFTRGYFYVCNIGLQFILSLRLFQVYLWSFSQ